MTRPIVRIYTAPAEFIDREMNDNEFAQYEVDQAEAETKAAEASAKTEAKASAKAKLAVLGLTIEEIAALY